MEWTGIGAAEAAKRSVTGVWMVACASRHVSLSRSARWPPARCPRSDSGRVADVVLGHEGVDPGAGCGTGGRRPGKPSARAVGATSARRSADGRAAPRDRARRCARGQAPAEVVPSSTYPFRRSGSSRGDGRRASRRLDLGDVAPHLLDPAERRFDDGAFQLAHASIGRANRLGCQECSGMARDRPLLRATSPAVPLPRTRSRKAANAQAAPPGMATSIVRFA